MNVTAAGRDGDALPRVAAALEKGTRNVTIEKIEVIGATKSGEQLFQEILQAAERAAASGGPSFTIRTG